MDCKDGASSKLNLEMDKITKIKEIIKREFKHELEFKEREVETIDTQLTKSKQLMKRLRYAIVANYYSKSNLLASQEEIKKFEDLEKERNPPSSILAGNSEESKGFLKQQPIHPSLKKLLGKKPIDYDEILSRRPPREAAKAAISNFEKLTKKKPEKHKNHTQTKNSESAQITRDTSETPVKIPRYISPIKTEKEIPKVNSSRGTNLAKNLIVVGNISKYLGDSSNSNGVTHKWMVYVKSKEGLTPEEIVDKARFHLHASYRPYDVVDVTMSPFQLTRLGWGEFPLRIELHFKDFVKQKPVQIIHNLTLDKTLSGLQTLGAETTVELWLDADIQNTILNKRKDREKEVVEDVKQEIPKESILIKQEKINCDNICDISNQQETKTVEIQAPIKTEDSSKITNNNCSKPELTFLTFLYDHDYPKDLIKVYKSTVSHGKLGSMNQPYFYVKPNDYAKKLLLEFHRKNIEDVQKSVEFLLKRLPLIDSRAKNSQYKRSFPFTTESSDVWKKYSTAKQISKEWSRAKFIGNFLKKKKYFSSSDLWTTKEILMFARQFGYSEGTQPTVGRIKNNGKLPNSTITLSNEIENWIESHEHFLKSKNNMTEELIDVDSIEPTTVASRNKFEIQTTNQILMDDCQEIENSFVDSTCRQIGIRLLPEEIIPGVMHLSSNKVMVTAVKCFLEKLLRSANSICSNSIVSPDDLKTVLMSCPEFDIFTNSGFGKLRKTDE